MAPVEVFALAYVGGKQAQLPRRSAALALQAGRGQARLRSADLGNLVAADVDRLGNGVEEGGACLA
ncbi:hypothetical protein D3C86_2199430 [compost metagenome]